MSGIEFKLIMTILPTVAKFFNHLFSTMKDISPEDRAERLQNLNSAFDKATGPERDAGDLEKWIGNRL